MTAGPDAGPTDRGSRTRGTSPYGWRLGSIAGVPVFLGRSYPISAIASDVFYGGQLDSPSRGQFFGYGVGLAYAAILLFSVLVHEAAHAFVARKMGHRVDRMVADLMGGHTVYEGGEQRPGSSAAISVVGPVANLVLALAGYGLTGLFPYGVTGLLIFGFTYSNLLVGVLNLLPGLPLDGGFVLQAAVWKVTGSRDRGLVVAGWAGRVLTALVIVGVIGRPLFNGQTPSLFNIVWGGLIGAFLWTGATSAIRAGQSGEAMRKVPLMRVLRPVAGAVAHESVAQMLARAGGFHGLVVAWDPDGAPVGVVDVQAARAVDPAQADRVLVASVVARQPDGWVVRSEAGADITGVIAAIVGRSGNGPAGSGQVAQVVLVVDPAGRPLGSVSLADLETALGG